MENQILCNSIFPFRKKQHHYSFYINAHCINIRSDMNNNKNNIIIFIIILLFIIQHFNINHANGIAKCDKKCVYMCAHTNGSIRWSTTTTTTTNTTKTAVLSLLTLTRIRFVHHEYIHLDIDNVVE